MGALSAVEHSLSEAFAMFWETLWALVLGFGLSGAVQAFVSRAAMQQVLGDHRPAAIGRAGFFGMVSSSCSYAAAALAKSLFARGADFTSAMVFMFASTNLVVELGILLWLLLGWQFAVAEFVGGAIMIVLLAVVVPRVIPATWIRSARAQLNTSNAESHPHHHGQPAENHDGEQRQPPAQRIRSLAGWADAAGYTISDLTMLRTELLIGFLAAGFATVLVPTWVWQSLFVPGHGLASSLENVALGPLLAMLAFVCSIGNVPLAAALWTGGISFGGVVAFIFADLITLPLLLIYRRYYGTRMTLRLLAVFWAVMTVAGLATESLFSAADLVPPPRPQWAAMAGVHWNSTTILNILALMAFAGLYWLYRHRERFGGGAGYAQDPMCGMQVDTTTAPAITIRDRQTYYFCSDHCQHRFTTWSTSPTDLAPSVCPVSGARLGGRKGVASKTRRRATVTGIAQCRAALSARLDGEDSPTESSAVDAHLVTCWACSQFREDATRLTKLVRFAPATPTPDVSARIVCPLDGLDTVVEALIDLDRHSTTCAPAMMTLKTTDMLSATRAALDCADIAAAAHRVLSRSTATDAGVITAILQATATAADRCATECGQHAVHHRHCRVHSDTAGHTAQLCRAQLHQITG